MTVIYRLTRIEANQPEKSVEFKDFEIDHILFGMEDYYTNQQYEQLEPELLEQFSSEISNILCKLGEI